MGTPIVTVDGACHRCDTILWPPDKSPRFVKATFGGIVDCGYGPPPAKNGTFVLERDPEWACFWEYENTDYFVWWYLEANRSTLVQMVVGPPESYYFDGQVDISCHDLFFHRMDHCVWPGYWGHSGWGLVTW